LPRPAEKLIPIARKSGLVNMMSLSCRFSPECRQLARLAAKGVFGELYYARARSIRRSGIPDWNLGFVKKAAARSATWASIASMPPGRS